MSAYCSQYRQVYQIRMLIGGMIFDMTGSYDFTLIVSVAASAVGAVSIVHYYHRGAQVLATDTRLGNRYLAAIATLPYGAVC